MRISTIILCIQACFTSMLIAGSLKAQNISLDFKKADVRQVFTAIEKQTHITFAYNKEDLEKLPAVAITVKEKTIGEVLSMLQTQLPLPVSYTHLTLPTKRIV